MTQPVLSIEDLAVSFASRRGRVEALQGVSLALARGETLGLVGESGSGKSVSAYALLRLLDAAGRIDRGSLHYDGIDLRAARESALRDLRGREVSMIFQNPRAALNPIRKVGQQIEDVLRQHARATRWSARGKAIDALAAVRIADPAARYHAYPFELSGGMCQRVVIALALACEPRLLIADEPTTGLDVTTQQAVMELIVELIRERQMSALLITHDLGLAARYCDRLAVMKDGRVVETDRPDVLLRAPKTAYARKLADATPLPGRRLRDLLPEAQRSPAPSHRTSDQPLLKVSHLSKSFHTKGGDVHAVQEVSFHVCKGQSMGLVGESGSGKSTLSAMIARLIDPDVGEIRLEGTDLALIASRRMARHPLRRRVQMVFQDATDSLDPRSTAAQCIAEPLRGLLALSRKDCRYRVAELADQVGLPESLLGRFPHQLSGGQRARVNIARAIGVSPTLLILDEPTAALDVSIQAIVLNLLADLRASLGMTYLFVSHDLNVVRLLCDTVMVMQAGRIIESGSTGEVLEQPQHPYTRELLSAALLSRRDVAASRASHGTAAQCLRST